MQNFNDNWQFKMEQDKTWKPVHIPHDWLIADAKNLYKSGVGCYKKIFTPEPLEAEQKLFLRFDGIYMDSTLYVNGQKAGEWKNGYTAFTQEITDFIKPGENEIIVTVNYQSPNSRWYSGAGIYRDCWLIKKDRIHFIIDGIYVTPRRVDDSDTWHIDIEAYVDYPSPMAFDENGNFAKIDFEPPSYDVHHQVRHLSTGEILEATNELNGDLIVTNPKIWDIDHPNCYILESRITAYGEDLDIVYTRFGFREIAFSATDGFFLNGRRVELNGVCQHHDLGALGSAVHKDALRRQLQTLREMGVNAIRTAHNPPAAVFMELADEMGFLIQSEFTDIWKRPKTKYDYARFFCKWAYDDVASWIRRDRNCPSIIMWSIGNEIYDTHASFEDGSATMQYLMDKVKWHDHKEHAPVTLCSNYMPWENTQKCADIIKLIGYNYTEYLYHDHHAKNPDWIIYGGETSSTVQSRGIYHFPLKKSLLSDDDLQCSALGNSAVSWGAKNTEACIIDHYEADFALGQFIWTGTDYIGEPTPYHTKNSYFGQIDTAGFPKDSFYIYKAAWTCNEIAPFVHLFPYWDWSPGQPIDVRIASNCAKVELFLNGKSLGATDTFPPVDNKFVANYCVPYEPGVIKAVAYDENGKIIAECERRSFGDAVALKLANTTIGELTFTEITALDADGNLVENATNRVKVTVKNGQLLGLDNGDSTDYDQYQGVDNRRMFSGKLLAISKGENGTAPDISAEIDASDIPIRKIELTRDGFNITAKTYPANATYHDLEWRLATDGGITSPLGNLKISGNTATLVPKGDGEVYIRCSTKNGQNHPTLISLLPITIEGYGTPFLDPYTFVSGGLYNCSNVPMTNGNDRGIATLRDGESQVGFANLDFGSFGSDEFTIGLFPLTGEPFPIDIWLGMPGESGARKLSTVTYDKGSIWNTYQDVTYKLPERLKGVQTLCFVVQLKVHIKGFQFKSKAFDLVPFTANDSIYGDSFTIKDSAIEGIGNNVTITFDGMNFENPATGIEISWRSKQDKNTIKLVFTDSAGNEVTNMLTLPAQDNYGSCKLQLENPLEGNGSVNFIFLPGSDIDLEWFKFST